MNIVGQRLKELRMNARYSQKQIAEKCETTQVTVCFTSHLCTIQSIQGYAIPKVIVF